MTENTALDRTFHITLIGKGLLGISETIGGIAILLIGQATIMRWANSLTESRLASNPHDFFGTHIMKSANEFATGSRLFAAFYLLSHGVSKFGLVVALFKRKKWAYPGMIVLLLAFIAYQLYRIVWVKMSYSLVGLTIFDFFMIWLTWHEYEVQKARHTLT